MAPDCAPSPGPKAILTCLVLNAGALFVAVRLALAAGSGVRCSRFILATLSGYVVVIHTAVLLVGLLGWLTIGGLAVVVAIAVAAAWSLVRRRVDEPTSAASVSTFTPAVLFAPVLAAITAVAWMWPHLGDATRLWIWDDYTYHLVYPALWLRERTIAAVTPVHAFTMQAWYPMSAGVVATWFMVPFSASRAESLAWVSLTGPVYAGIVISGAAELAGRLGSRPFAWAIPVVLFATSQRTGVMASSFSDADLALAAALFGALVFAIPRSVDESARVIAIDAWYAASLTGLALGVKASAAPAAIIVLLVMVLRARHRAATRIAAIFAVSWIAMAGYWYARNIAHTGNPVYPAAFLSQPGTTFPHTTLREYAQRYGVARTVGDAASVYLDWPVLHGALAVIGLIGLAGWFVSVGAKTRGERSFAFATLAIVAVTLGLLPITPFSAGNDWTFVSGFIHWDSMRYIALLPILGWVALGFLVGTGVHPARTIVAIAIMVAAVLAGLPRSAAMVVLALAVPGAVIAALARPRASRRLVPVALVTGVLVAAALGVWEHGTKSAATAAGFHREPLFGAAAAALDRLPDGTRVAVFGDQWIYPMFGDRYHLVPIRLDGDGRIATHPVGDAMEPGPLTVDAPTLWENLTASRIDVVTVVHLPHPGRSPEWPQQHRALETLGARLLHRDGAVAIWALNRAAR
ncbi:MAG TPA: hypothetical protein VJZ73_20515 [Methylomirabilota bacterium]|nr:hypothetical protein [Methylomirabilota bacterium]